jgi:hypothetical protein
MKKQLFLILAVICLSGIGMTAYAYRPGPPPGPPEHLRAQRVLDVTKDSLLRAQRVAHRHGSEHDRLQTAFSYQRRAREYYRQGRYQRTIRYSLRAREIADSIINHHARRHAPPPPPPRHGRDDGGSSINIRLKL